MTFTLIPERPFTRSYWVVPGRLLAGYFPGDRNAALMERKLHALLDCGIRHIINLMEAHEIDREGRPFVEYQAEFERLAAQRGYVVAVERQPIRDMDVPDFGHMRRILDGIDAALAADRPVYVHCWGGQGPHRNRGRVLSHAAPYGGSTHRTVQDTGFTAPGGACTGAFAGDKRTTPHGYGVACGGVSMERRRMLFQHREQSATSWNDTFVSPPR